MNKIITILILSMFSTFSYSQNCKEVKTKEDPFTKNVQSKAKLTVGKKISIGRSTSWEFEFIQENGETVLKIHAAALGELNNSIGTETSIYFLLESGEVIQLFNTETSIPVSHAVASQMAVNVFSTFFIILKLSKEDLNLLGSSPLSDMRLDIPNFEVLSPKVNNKTAKSFSDISNCLASKME
ncbi:MAG TPA: hypothetical protein VK027_04435 [Chitinophagaceae bacterium]|nr:hypothetical protein [Chitinophagaceae bacterium]